MIIEKNKTSDFVLSDAANIAPTMTPNITKDP